MMEGKGIGTIGGGVSFCSRERDIYTVQSSPKLSPEALKGFAETNNVTDEALLARLKSGRLATAIKTGLMYLCLGVFTPFYLVFYCIPKWISDNILRPAMHAVSAIVMPPVKALRDFIQRQAMRIQRYYAKKQEQIIRTYQRIAAAVNRAYHRLWDPIHDWIVKQTEKIQRLIQRIWSAFVTPIQAAIEWMRKKMAIIRAFVGGKVSKMAEAIQVRLSLVAQKAGKLQNAVYQILLKGGMIVNACLRSIAAYGRIFPRYLIMIWKEVVRELREWFSFQ